MDSGSSLAAAGDVVCVGINVLHTSMPVFVLNWGVRTYVELESEGAPFLHFQVNKKI